MPRFAANLSMMYPEHDFLDRFAAAAADGFRAVEYLFPYAYTPQQLSDCLRQAGLVQALFNLPPGDWDAGERGLAALPGREAAFADSVEQALAYAQVLGCRRVHAMAGIIAPGADVAAMRATYLKNLAWAARRCAEVDVSVLIEPINPRDMPGYFLTHQAQAHAIVAEVGAPNLKVQMDFYHCQIVEGDLAKRLEAHIKQVGHVQIAGVPLRHEPDTGEVSYPYLFEMLDWLGYTGYVGCEYRPRGNTSAGLGWFQPWKARQ